MGYHTPVPPMPGPGQGHRDPTKAYEHLHSPSIPSLKALPVRFWVALFQVNSWLYSLKQMLLNSLSLLNIIPYFSGAEACCVDEHGAVQLIDALLFKCRVLAQFC